MIAAGDELVSVSLPRCLAALTERQLQWWPNVGIGYLPMYDPNIYDEAYYHKYEGYDASPLGMDLTKARKDFVRKHYTGGNICDVGIGAGAFATAIGSKGYDINPTARAWLEIRKLWCDPRRSRHDVLTFWDSMEHIPDPTLFLSHINGWAFISMPIYKDVEDCLRSKHYRPNEHLWYFTDEGLVRFMRWHGFECKARDDFESALGRDSIVSYAFARFRTGQEHS